jgi:hypothetical protein
VRCADAHYITSPSLRGFTHAEFKQSHDVILFALLSISSEMQIRCSDPKSFVSIRELQEAFRERERDEFPAMLQRHVLRKRRCVLLYAMSLKLGYCNKKYSVAFGLQANCTE